MPFLLPGLERTGALLAARSGQVDATASRVKNLAESIAGSTRGSGAAYVKGFKVKKVGRGLDRLVVNVSSLAAPIEFGHVVRNREGGPVLGYVKGLHIMAKTYQRLRATGD